MLDHVLGSTVDGALAQSSRLSTRGDYGRVPSKLDLRIRQERNIVRHRVQWAVGPCHKILLYDRTYKQFQLQTS